MSTGTNAVLRAWRGKSEVFWCGNTRNDCDVVHLNSLALHKHDVYVTAFGEFQSDSWLDARSGYVVNASSGEVLHTGLYHPHSLCFTGSTWWVCKSLGGRVLSSSGTAIPVNTGYLRGLAFLDDVAVVGSSHFRHRSRSTGEALGTTGEMNLGTNTTGLSVFSANGKGNWSHVKFIDLSSVADEIYDVLLVKESTEFSGAIIGSE